MTSKTAASRAIRRSALLSTILTGEMLVAACGDDSDDPPAQDPRAPAAAEIKAVSSHPDKITGGT